MQKGINSSVDRNAEESGTDSRPVSSRASRKLQDDNPPYDFSAALDIKDSNQGSPANVRPGRTRKGNQYDIPAAGKPAHQKRRGSWDDSEEDEDEKIIMEELRGVMEDEMEVPERRDQSPNKDIPETTGNKTEKDLRHSKQKWSFKKMKKKPSSNLPNKEKRNMIISQQHLMASSADFELPGLSEEDIFPKEGEYLSGEEITEKGLVKPGFQDSRYIYFFHQGSTHYFDTRNRQEELFMGNIADKSERLVRKYVAEFFSALRIVVDFFVILFLELLRFLIFRVIGAFLIGIILICGDFLLKPFLTSCFNSIVQPMSSFCYNCAVAGRTISIPVRDMLTALCTPCAMLIRAFRLVEINWNSRRYSEIEEI